MPDVGQAIAWEVQFLRLASFGIAAMQLLTAQIGTRNPLSRNLPSPLPLLLGDVAESPSLEVHHVVSLS